MKSTSFTSLAFIFLFLISCASSTTSGSSGAKPADPKIFTEIMAGSAAGWNEGNLDKHLAIYDTEATFVTSKGLISVAALKQNFQKKYFNGTQPKQQLSFHEIQVKPLGAEHALVTGKFLLQGGGEAEHSGRFSLVFGKTAQGWKVLHDHSS